MSKRREDRVRDLLDEIDARLRDAQRLRNHAEQHKREAPFWPDRRHGGRVPDLHSPQRRDENSRGRR
jgi:hypothetical protein